MRNLVFVKIRKITKKHQPLGHLGRDVKTKDPNAFTCEATTG